MSKIIVPQHVAIIPDGNRRWAKDNSVATKEGHRRGVETFRLVVNHAADRGVESISMWGMSLDNFIRRSPLEIRDLLDIFNHQFQDMLEDDDIHNRGIRVRIFGRWREKFPRKLVSLMNEVESVTKKYSNYALNLLLAYNGTDEMTQAVQRIVDSGKRRVTSRMIKNNLFTKDVPPVDLLVRTGGQPHLSAGFMMWDIADAEFHFTETYWPAFGTKDFDVAIEDFAGRKRSRGK